MMGGDAFLQFRSFVAAECNFHQLQRTSQEDNLGKLQMAMAFQRRFFDEYKSSKENEEFDDDDDDASRALSAG